MAERFFDEAGGMQLVLHAPFGSRINKAWGYALRKRFCRSFNFELQAAATENGIVLSLSDQHSFPLSTVFGYIRSHNARELLVQALLAVPLFGTRWRWVANRSLAILRFQGGRKVPSPLQRIRSDDLLASIFPEQAACLEHIVGDIEIPDHPLIRETLRECQTDAMDIEGLEATIRALEAGEIECHASDTREPSPFSQEILNANPYAYLDDAPLEERRTRAVQSRRSLPEGEEDLAQLDSEAIRQVTEESSPTMRDREEVHDALLTLLVMPGSEVVFHDEELKALVAQGRAVGFKHRSASESIFWSAAERFRLVQRIYPEMEPANLPAAGAELDKAQWVRDSELDRNAAIAELLQARLSSCGPTSAPSLCGLLGLTPLDIEQGLHALEAQGAILRGQFTPGSSELEWCDRRLLARIHRRTLGRLRKEIQPVSTADFVRFLFEWQAVGSDRAPSGIKGISWALDQLQGLEIPAAAWEKFILPARVSDYQSEFRTNFVSPVSSPGLGSHHRRRCLRSRQTSASDGSAPLDWRRSRFSAARTWPF